MGMTQEVAELLSAIDEVKPIIEKALPILGEVGALLKPVLADLCDVNVEMTHHMVTKYKALGYDEAVAIELTMWNKQNMAKANK